MRFSIAVKKGGEVRFAGEDPAKRTVYYGAPPETGMWYISLVKLEDYVYSKIKNSTFGQSVEDFIFGFDLAELEEWGNFFTSKKDHVGYHPKDKQIVAVGQLDWAQVKELTPTEQYRALASTLTSSISRISSLKRKPKDFDLSGFSEAIQTALDNCPLDLVQETPWTTQPISQ